ncbi:MAG: FAD-dependent oxidoreductase [Candidatus Lokiarchaeota archaeon]|nr:FAD-dependent oxidoreductase [Candidatus Lokiarchaeota archaeon]
MTETTSNKDQDIKHKAAESIIAKIKESANYCYSCNKCTNVCPMSHLGVFSPRNLISDLIFLSLDEALEKNNIWYCLTCGRCNEYCPMTKDNVGVNIVNIVKELRSLTSENELLQNTLVSCHHTRIYSSLPKLMADDKIKFTNKLGFLKGTGLKIKDKGEIAYFLGCIPFLNGTAPCVIGCPAGVDVQGYISLISEGKFQESIDLIREKNPLPYLCGRICTSQCALNCNRQYFDDPVAIRELKRFVSDWEVEHPNQSKIKPVDQTKEKVAIIGAGPAGLSAAYFLARLGYKPTIFEKGDKTVGVVRYGVPQYRLSDEALDHDIDFIQNMGVEIILNKTFGPDLTLEDLRNENFKTVFIAVGLYIPRTLKLEGEDLPNVHVALDFLLERKYNCVENLEEFKNKTFGIIGGGAVAVDVGETAIRLGATKVDLVDIVSKETLINVLKDLHDAEKKIMEYHFETSTVNITKESGGKLALNCYKIKWGEPDPKTGRRSLNKIEGSEFKIVVDHIVIAIGQGLDMEPLNIATDQKLKIKRGKIVVDELTYETGISGVFAGGDIVNNSLMCAADAIGDGREAAFSIDRYLQGINLKEGRIRRKDLKRSPIPKKNIQANACQIMNFMPNKERLVCFDEMELGYTKDQAIKEANRCLNCNCCCNSDQILEDFDKSLDPFGVMNCNYGNQSNLKSINSPDYLEIPKSVIGILNQNNIIPVVLQNEKCCGHDILACGDMNSFKKLAEYNVKLFKEAGVKKIIFSCAEGYYTWKNDYKSLFKKEDFNLEIYHITEYIIQENLMENIIFPQLDNIKVTYHDACRLGRLGGIYNEPREILKQIPGIELVEMKNSREDADCCGVNAYINCNQVTKNIQKDRIQQAIDVGAEYIITSCPKCLTHFNCYLNENKELKKRINVIDITSFLGKRLFLF